jgi:hypothetical protein
MDDKSEKSGTVVMRVGGGSIGSRYSVTEEMVRVDDDL